MARILNNILCTLMVFLLCFAWVTFCLKDTKIAAWLALTVAICSCYLFFRLQKVNFERNKKKQNRKKTLKDFASFLQFNADNCAVFMPMLCYYNYIAERVDFDNIIISQNKPVFVAICYEKEVVNFDKLREVLVAAKRKNCEKLWVFGNRFEGRLLQLANDQIPTEFFDLENTYNLFYEAGKLPIFTPKNVHKLRFLPKIAFCKQRFGWYILGAFYMLAISYFSYLKIYLLAWATVLFLLALYSLLNTKYNTKSTNVKLEK